jgi:phosphoribosylformylglycinamidine cyclo-ligase
MIDALAHITGGGLLENVPRALPQGCHARIDADAWEQPRLMAFLQGQGNIEPPEMARTFNCGVGMVLMVAPDKEAEVTRAVEDAGETVLLLGTVEAGQRGCTVFGQAGTWAAREAWETRHDA